MKYSSLHDLVVVDLTFKSNSLEIVRRTGQSPGNPSLPLEMFPSWVVSAKRLLRNSS